MSVTKCTKIRHIVRIRQMLQRWKNKASSNQTPTKTPSDVPDGHVAVCVGSRCTRFVVRATYLNHPVFQKLLVEAEEEYGFEYDNGPLAIPCDESLFEDVIRFISKGSNESTRFLSFEDFCRVGFKTHWSESRPLLHEKTVW